MTFTTRTVTVSSNSAGRFVLRERSGSIIPLNSNGYANGTNLLKAAAKLYSFALTSAGVELSGLAPNAEGMVICHEGRITRQAENVAAAHANALKVEAARAEAAAALAAAPFHVTVKHGRHPAVVHAFADRAAALDFARKQVGEDTLGYGGRVESDRNGRFVTARIDGFGYHHEAVVTPNAEYVEAEAVAALPSPDAKAWSRPVAVEVEEYTATTTYAGGYSFDRQFSSLAKAELYASLATGAVTIAPAPSR